MGIIQDIEADFENALTGIFKLPEDARFGVYTAYKYYYKLLLKLNELLRFKLKIHAFEYQTIRKWVC